MLGQIPTAEPKNPLEILESPDSSANSEFDDDKLPDQLDVDRASAGQRATLSEIEYETTPCSKYRDGSKQKDFSGESLCTEEVQVLRERLTECEATVTRLQADLERVNFIFLALHANRLSIIAFALFK